MAVMIVAEEERGSYVAEISSETTRLWVPMSDADDNTRDVCAWTTHTHDVSVCLLAEADG